MKKIKITKEQYDRIFNSSIINENAIASTEKPKTDSKGGNDKITKEIKDLLKHLYGYTPEFNKEFWVDEKGKSSEEIIDHLVSKGLIVKKGRNYIVPKSLGSKEEAKSALDESMREFVGEPKQELDEMDGGYPAGAEHDPRAPYNQKDPEPIYNRTDYEIFVYNDDLAILKYKRSNEFYVLDFYKNHVDYEGSELTEDDINDFLNNNEPDLEKILIPINLEILNELDDMYNLNGYFRKKIEDIKAILVGGLREGVDWSKAYPREKGKPKMNDVSPKKRTGPENQAILDKVRALRKRELDTREPMKSKKPMDQEEIDETSCAGGGSVGAFVAPMGTEPIKREIKETLSVAGAGNFQYDTPGLANVGRNGEFKESKKKTKAQSKTQWAGGAFVELDDCTKLNNNKTAQNGGCSTGAVDNVVKLKKTSGNINAPSLKEGMMREALKLQHDRNEGKLIVISDLEGRAASQETFHNKAVLKQNGFNWNGTNWVIDSNKLDVAKQTLSLVNKAEYIIDQLEDLEDAVENSTADNKDLLKARIDQYIMDLANATDEVALSAEIRRYLTFFSKFHSYSFYNRMLIFIQKPDATKVGSFKLWESKFRRVKKGSKAIKVLAPVGSPKVDTSTSSDDAELDMVNQLGGNRPMVTRFRAVNVFDISDTEPIDERGDVPDSPQWWSENIPSETADILFGAVSEVAADLGIRVTQSDAQGGEKGYSAGDHINISSDVSGAGRLATAIHEIAHELMHWKKSSIYYIDNGEGRLRNELQELQAESVSYVVMKHYGIPVAHHATYLALWKANKERIHNNLEIISKVAQFIIDKIDKQVTNTEKQ